MATDEKPDDSHYTQYGGIEPRDMIVSSSMPGYKAIVIEYVYRAGLKLAPGKSASESEIEDLNKVIGWLEHRQAYLRATLRGAD